MLFQYFGPYTSLLQFLNTWNLSYVALKLSKFGRHPCKRQFLWCRYFKIREFSRLRYFKKQLIFLPTWKTHMLFTVSCLNSSTQAFLSRGHQVNHYSWQNCSSEEEKQAHQKRISTIRLASANICLATCTRLHVWYQQIWCFLTTFLHFQWSDLPA